ncbi:DUF4837 family protein [bacterium]|nr:DUF4837 family protein [bacterium]
MKRTIPVLVLILTVILATGCSVLKRDASEGDTLLAVAVEGSHAELVKPYVRRALERSIRTPQDEKRFYTTFVTEDSLGPVSRWQNVLLIGALDSDDQISQRIQRMLDGEVLEGVRSGKYAVFRQKDVWARGQAVVVVVGATRASMMSWLQANGDELYNLFKEARDERMAKKLYSVYEQEELADSLRKANGWTLRIPHDFGVVSSGTNPGFVRLRRFYPDRFLTVSWREGTADDVNDSTLLAWKDSLAAGFADPQQINPAFVDSREMMIGGLRAIEVHGLWETKGAIGGGPYVSYLLHDEGTLYLLDGQVFAPDRSKELYIRQLEVVLNSFQP